MTAEGLFDAKHSKLQEQLVKRDGTSNWRRPKSLLLLLGIKSSLRSKSSLLLRLIELYRDGSCWDEGAFWARLGCNIYWPVVLFWTSLSSGGLGA